MKKHYILSIKYDSEIKSHLLGGDEKSLEIAKRIGDEGMDNGAVGYLIYEAENIHPIFSTKNPT